MTDSNVWSYDIALSVFVSLTAW